MTTIRRWTMSAIALVLLCGNALVALQPQHVVERGIGIPRPEWLVKAFVVTSMFYSSSDRNEDYVISGRRTQTGVVEDRGQWVMLPLQEHIPFRSMLAGGYLRVQQHQSLEDRMAQRRAWAVLARKTRANHNRLHPDRPVSQVRFGVVDWPKDGRGFRARKVPSLVQSRVWFTEDDR